jgi:hypothetical protein
MAAAIGPAAGAGQTDSAADQGDPAEAARFESSLQSAPRTATAAPIATQTAPHQPPEQFQHGAATGQTLARYGDHDLRADERSNQHFGSQDAATAFARSLGVPAAVVEENGRYAAYRIHAEKRFFQGDFSRQNTMSDDNSNATNVQCRHPALRALVTTDDFVVRTDGGVGTLDPAGSPFSSHIQAFGPGLERMNDRVRFERQFEQAMRDTAFAALDSSQRAVQDIHNRLNANDLTPQDRSALAQALRQLAPLDQRIVDKQKQVHDAYWNFVESSYAAEGGSQWAIDAQSKIYDTFKQRQAELAQLKAQRAVAARDFPLALRIDNLDQFRHLSNHDQTAVLRGAADGVLNDIATTRANIANGRFNLRMMDGVRNATAAGLGVQGEQLGWVEDRATGERRSDAAWKIGETALTIGLAVGGASFSGSTSLTLLGASTALGVHGAVDTTADYLRNRAAANTGLDRRRS